ncbi:MAG: hypothetical protein IJU40_07525 [Desulfovibrionaceae bacterium]|nr:hypothetical protein [Desulfovibrionaceae bacterium]
MLSSQFFPEEHPNFDYSFNFEINYTGQAKIIGEAYAINKLKFCGSGDSFEFKKGVSTSNSKYYPRIKIINEQNDSSEDSCYYTYDVNFEDDDTSDIRYTATFDCSDFDISSFKISYARRQFIV